MFAVFPRIDVKFLIQKGPLYNWQFGGFIKRDESSHENVSAVRAMKEPNV